MALGRYLLEPRRRPKCSARLSRQPTSLRDSNRATDSNAAHQSKARLRAIPSLPWHFSANFNNDTAAVDRRVAANVSLSGLSSPCFNQPRNSSRIRNRCRGESWRPVQTMNVIVFGGLRQLASFPSQPTDGYLTASLCMSKEARARAHK